MPPTRRRQSIGARMTAAFLTVSLLALASGLLGLIGMQRASDAAAILLQDAEMIQSVQELRLAVSALDDPPSAFQTGDEAEAYLRFQNSLNLAQARLDSYLTEHSRHRHSVKHTVFAQDIIDETRENLGEIANLGEAMNASGLLQTANGTLAELQEVVDATDEGLNLLLADTQQDIEEAEKDLAAAERDARIGLSVSALIAVVLAIFFAVRLTRSISAPMAQLAEAADAIAGGDLSSSVNINAKGEIGLLAESFERMRRTLVHERGQLRLLAILEERDRIGREMHDGLAQVLGYVNTKAQAIGEFLRAGQPQLAERQIGELVSAAREAYTDAREVIVGLRIDEISQRALGETISEYVERFNRQHKVPVSLEISPTWDESLLTATARTQVLRIVQEALTNARKHASASKISITLERDGYQAVVRVEDDGRGFNLSRLLRPDYDRYGLRTMRERAQAIGGNFRIESKVDHGTSIILRIPAEPGSEGGGS